MQLSPAATIIIPTHDSTWTLWHAIESAHSQTILDLEILVVGDGVTTNTRGVIENAKSQFSRVRFLDLPKGPNRGENNRDFGVREASSENIFYLADDDLLLRNHVENLLPLLKVNVLVQSMNGFVDSTGKLGLYPTDLSRPDCVGWHLQETPRNCVSITGTAHRKSTYLSLKTGWEVPPEEIWADLHLWRKFFTLQDFKGATHAKMTTIQFPAPFRKEMSLEGFRQIYAPWLDLIRKEEAEELLEEIVRVEIYSSLVTSHLITSVHKESCRKSMEEIDLKHKHDQLTQERDQLIGNLQAVLKSKTWKALGLYRRIKKLLSN